MARLTRSPLPPLASPPKYVSTRQGRAALDKLHEKAPELWKPIDKAYRTDWFRHRLREYVAFHGYASAGVCTLLEKAAAAFADADYIRGLGAEANDPELLIKAHRLNVLGKGLEAAAMEIAAREGALRKEANLLATGRGLAHALSEPVPKAPKGSRGYSDEPDGIGRIPSDDPWPGDEPDDPVVETPRGENEGP
jgi:hypothetical protein